MKVEVTCLRSYLAHLRVFILGVEVAAVSQKLDPSDETGSFRRFASHDAALKFLDAAPGRSQR